MGNVGRPLRILHLPVDLGGHAKALAKEQRRLGYDAQAVTLAHSDLGFNGDECFDSPVGTPNRLMRREIGRYRLLWRSLASADVIHCHFGQTTTSVRALPLHDPTRSGPIETAKVAYAWFIWLRDLGLWRWVGKCVAMTFYGDDVRLVAASLARNPWTPLRQPALKEALEPRDALKRRMVRVLARNSVRMFAMNPDLLVALPPGSTFLPYAHVDPNRHVVVLPAAEGKLRLLHLPTHRDIKGTSLFVEAVEKLRAEGLQVDLTVVEGVANDEALRTIAQHDVVLDQLRVGWYGGVAVEAMAMGKPVVAYLNAADLALVPSDLRESLPIVRADPSNIEQSLRTLVTGMRSRLRDIGAQSRAFVERWHDPSIIARFVVECYIGQLHERTMGYACQLTRPPYDPSGLRSGRSDHSLETHT